MTSRKTTRRYALHNGDLRDYQCRPGVIPLGFKRMYYENLLTAFATMQNGNPVRLVVYEQGIPYGSKKLGAEGLFMIFKKQRRAVKPEYPYLLLSAHDGEMCLCDHSGQDFSVPCTPGPAFVNKHKLAFADNHEARALCERVFQELYSESQERMLPLGTKIKRLEAQMNEALAKINFEFRKDETETRSLVHGESRTIEQACRVKVHYRMPFYREGF